MLWFSPSRSVSCLAMEIRGRMQRESPRISAAAAASSLLILRTGEAAKGGTAISANGRAPGNAARSEQHLGSNIVQSVSKVAESVGLFVCRETL